MPAVFPEFFVLVFSPLVCVLPFWVYAERPAIFIFLFYCLC